MSTFTVTQNIALYAYTEKLRMHTYYCIFTEFTILLTHTPYSWGPFDPKIWGGADIGGP